MNLSQRQELLVRPFLQTCGGDQVHHSSALGLPCAHGGAVEHRIEERRDDHERFVERVERRSGATVPASAAYPGSHSARSGTSKRTGIAIPAALRLGAASARQLRRGSPRTAARDGDRQRGQPDPGSGSTAGAAWPLSSNIATTLSAMWSTQRIGPIAVLLDVRASRRARAAGTGSGSPVMRTIRCRRGRRGTDVHTVGADVRRGWQARTAAPSTGLTSRADLEREPVAGVPSHCRTEAPPRLPPGPALAVQVDVDRRAHADAPAPAAPSHPSPPSPSFDEVQPFQAAGRRRSDAEAVPASSDPRSRGRLELGRSARCRNAAGLP